MARARTHLYRSNVASHGSIAYRLWLPQGGTFSALATYNGPFYLEQPPSVGVYGARQAGQKITGWKGRLNSYVKSSRARFAYLLSHVTVQRAGPRPFLRVAFRLSRATATAPAKSRISNRRRDLRPYPRARWLSGQFACCMCSSRAHNPARRRPPDRGVRLGGAFLRSIMRVSPPRR